MTKRTGKILLTTLIGLAVLTTSGCRHRREYPNRPILLICPWAAGGGTDRVSRQVAALLEQKLDVPVNVINATGGAGVTGHTRGALAKPDGYTLTMVTVEINMLHWRGLTNVSHHDYQPVGLLNRDAAALFVRGDAPWQSLAELQEYVRANPGQLKASGTAAGGIWHLAFAGWLNREALNPADAIWVSMNVAAPSLQELLAGGVDTVCCSLPEAQSLVESGRVRCLGVMADDRVQQFPTVPTFKEQGINWTMTGWRGVCVPEDTPPEIVRSLTGTLAEVSQSDDFRTFMRRAGFNATWQPPELFGKTLSDVDSQLGELLTSEAFSSVQETRLGPMFFPSLLGVMFLAAVTGLAAGGGLRRPSDVEPLSGGDLLRTLEVVAWVVAYLFLAETAGFVITSAALLAVWSWRLGGRWPATIAISLLAAVTMYQLFAIALHVPLPRGWLGW